MLAILSCLSKIFLRDLLIPQVGFSLVFSSWVDSFQNFGCSGGWQLQIILFFCFKGFFSHSKSVVKEMLFDTPQFGFCFYYIDFLIFKLHNKGLHIG